LLGLIDFIYTLPLAQSKSCTWQYVQDAHTDSILCARIAMPNLMSNVTETACFIKITS